MSKTYKYLLLFMMLFSVVLNAQEAKEAQGEQDGNKQPSAEELATELANPNTTLGTMNFNLDYVNYQGYLPGAHSQNSFTVGFQPVLPIPLSETVNLYVRPDIPIVVTQPTFNGAGFDSQKAGLGNISADIAVGKTFPSKFIAVLGGFASFRTASHKELKSPYTFVGPEFVLAQLFKWGAVGVMVNHAWNVSKYDPTAAAGIGTFSVNGNDVFLASQIGTKAQVTAGQYFYVVSMGNGLQITGSPTYSINHNAPKGEKLTFPVSVGASKVVFLGGKLPVKFNMQYWYYLASPDAFGPQHQVRVTITPVIPLPW